MPWTTATEPPPAKDHFDSNGILAFFLASVLAAGLFLFSAMNNNACSDSAKAVALANGHRDFILIGLGLAAVPGLWLVAAIRSHRIWWSWAMLCGAVLLITALGAFSSRSEPMSVCF